MCSKQQAETNELDLVEDESIELPEDFHDFYEKFHEDSIFQLKHIQFPLPQKVYILDSSDLVVDWRREIWEMHKAGGLNNTEYHHFFEMLGDEMIVEKHIHRNFPLEVERRWAKLGSEWTLIFYYLKEPRF